MCEGQTRQKTLPSVVLRIDKNTGHLDLFWRALITLGQTSVQTTLALDFAYIYSVDGSKSRFLSAGQDLFKFLCLTFGTRNQMSLTHLLATKK